MSKLSTFLTWITKRCRSTVWYGPRPDAREGRLTSELAAKLDYPQSEYDIKKILREIPVNEAAAVLAVMANGSLAYPKSPREAVIKDAQSALSEMHADARFFTNGDWGAPSRTNGHGWVPMSRATFDTGLIGFDGNVGFAIWMEDED